MSKQQTADRQDLIKKSLSAVFYQKADVKNRLKGVVGLDMPELEAYWQGEIAELESTYQGLLDWLHDLNQS